MAETRVTKLSKAILTCLEQHDSPIVTANRAKRLPGLIERWQMAVRHTECPRCNSLDVQLTENAISYRSGLVDKTERVCGICVKEILAVRGGYAPVYTTG